MGPGYGSGAYPERVFKLDAATVLLQWAAGGLLFLWFTTRRRAVSLGYGWLLRGVYAAIAAVAAVVGVRYGTVPVREVSSVTVAVAALAVLAVSVVRRRAGVAGHSEEFDRRSARVAAMTGIERQTATPDRVGREFAPALDLIAPVLAVPGLVAAAVDASGAGAGNVTLSIVRTLVGAAFLGAVTDAMLLGHWYLTQPGLPRKYLHELVTALGWVWPFEVAVLLVPTGMVSVLNGSIDDQWNGTLGWMWVACALTTGALVWVTRLALRERYYSAVMAATGLLYLAILTAFGTDLVARAVLAG